MTPLQQDERDAMTGDRSALLRVVSGLREYRTLMQRLADARYSDSAVDGVTIQALLSAANHIEGLED